MNKKSNLPLYLAFASVIITALLVRTYIFNIRKIEGDSMSPYLKNGDIVFISMVSKKYLPGDVVIFQSPLRNDVVLIKRIIAPPNSKIFINDYKVILNDQALESTIKNKTISVLETKEVAHQEKGPVTYEAHWKLNSLYCRYSEILHSKSNEYILFGDNRCNSSDSRVFGPISSHAIIGKVVFSMKLSNYF